MFQWRIAHVEIQSSRFFSQLMWNSNIKTINIIKLVLMIFNAWFGYFQDVGYLLHGRTLIVHNLITINFNWSTWTWSIIQWENLQHDTSQTFNTFNQSQHFLHTLHKPLCFSCIFTFFEISTICWKCCFLPSSVLK